MSKIIKQYTRTASLLTRLYKILSRWKSSANMHIRYLARNSVNKIINTCGIEKVKRLMSINMQLNDDIAQLITCKTFNKKFNEKYFYQKSKRDQLVTLQSNLKAFYK
jgi:hypothetical protein